MITVPKAAFDLVLERALSATPVTRREGVWNMENGDLKISFPSVIGLHECEWAEGFVALVMKGIRRRAEQAAAVASLGQDGTPDAGPGMTNPSLPNPPASDALLEKGGE